MQQFRKRIIAAGAGGSALRIHGGATKDWYGEPPRGEPLDTRSWCGIGAYDPTELVITARCGTPLSEIEAILAEQNQMLAFEPPHFGASTIGGVVASGLSGPRRATAGAVRDFMLGAVLMDGRGEVLHFGGQVMKNVAGYDVSRLLTGSMGTLGLILEVSLKVLPRPFAEASLRFDMNQSDAIRRLNEWGGQPLPISASAWHDGILSVRLSGAEAAVQAARVKMGGDALVDAAGYWATVRDQTHEFFSLAQDASEKLWRLSVPSVTLPLAVPGSTMIEWGGAQRWLRSGADSASIRAAVDAVGGHATLFRGGDNRSGVFHPLAPAVASIHHNLKNAFDPHGVFNPGRMYLEF